MQSSVLEQVESTPTAEATSFENTEADLKTLFTELSSRSPEAVREAAKARIAEHPLADKINYIEDNFYDILSQLEDNNKVDIKC